VSGSTQMHPEHCRTSCSDERPINADAEGSTGCARCTAILLDRGSEAEKNFRLLMKAVGEAHAKTCESGAFNNIDEVPPWIIDRFDELVRKESR
jgi:hypothetical protein